MNSHAPAPPLMAVWEVLKTNFKKGVYLHSIVWKSNQLCPHRLLRSHSGLFVHGAGVNQSEYTFELSLYSISLKRIDILCNIVMKYRFILLLLHAEM